MKKFFLTMAVAIAGSICSQAAGPVYFEANFANADAWPGGWTTKGCNAELMEAAQNVWGDAGPYKIIDFPGKGTFACSTSNFKDGSIQANEWLISPTIHIDEDNALLCYTVAATNIENIGLNSNSYKVRISTEGADPDKFEENALGSYVLNGALREMAITLKGYKGKDVNIAFVNDSKQPGVLGFGNIYVGSYFIELTNNTVEYITPTTVKLQAKMRTPLACPGIEAELVANDKVISTFSNNVQLFGDYSTFEIEFPDRLEVNAEDVENLPYTVKITPSYSGAQTYEFDSSVKSSVNYTTKVVVEECTGTWCQFCPRGTVSLDYYSDKYPDTFLGIAVHGYTYGVEEPMAFGSPRDYIYPLGGQQGFPMGRINRDMSFIYNFGNSTTVPPFFDVVCVNDIAVKELELDEENKTLALTYEARLGFTADNRTYKVVAVVTEDDVTGTTSGYDQMNAYSYYDTMELMEEYGADWMPYWKKFTEAPMTIKARDMVYNHVARALYPSFDGQVIASKWEKDTPVEGNISFKLPINILDYEKTKVNLLMLDSDGRIVTFASKYLKGDGPSHGDDPDNPPYVESINAVSYTATVNGSSLLISAEAGAKAEVYAADGSMVSSTVLKYSTANINIDGLSGMHIVRIAGAEGSKAVKMIF